MLTTVYRDTVTVVRPGVRTTRGGGVVADWAGAQRFGVGRLVIQPAAQGEAESAERGLRTTGYRLISAPGTHPDIRATDRIEWRGVTYEVVGEVADWHGRVLGHVEASIERTEG